MFVFIYQTALAKHHAQAAGLSQTMELLHTFINYLPDSTRNLITYCLVQQQRCADRVSPPCVFGGRQPAPSVEHLRYT